MRIRRVGVRIGGACALLGATASAAIAFDRGLDVALRPEIVYQGRNRHSLLNPEGRLVRVDEVSGLATSDFRLRLSPVDSIELRVRDRWIVSAAERALGSRNFLEDAFVVVKVTPQFQISTGKDRVREGVGYAWNPVDFFRTRTPAAGASQDPKEQRDHRPGHYLLRAEGRWGQRGLAVSGLRPSRGSTRTTCRTRSTSGGAATPISSWIAM